MIDDGIELAGPCQKCQATTLRRQCDFCDDGYSDHDCGEDCCCCFEPEPNVRCDMCGGHGEQNWCRECGWDLLRKRYINDECRKLAEADNAPTTHKS